MISHCGNQPIHLNPLLALEEFLIILKLSFKTQFAEFSEWWRKHKLLNQRPLLWTIWPLHLVNANTSVAHRNNSDATFCSDTKNDCWHRIHSISNPLDVVTSIFWSRHMGSYPGVWNCPVLDWLCNWLLIDQSELSSPLHSSVCFHWQKHRGVTVTYHWSS